MKISNKYVHSLRAMFDIAYNGCGKPEQLLDIARRQQFPPRYLEQLFQHYIRAGLSISKRGPQGGYILSRESENISILEIIAGTEQHVALDGRTAKTTMKPTHLLEQQPEGWCVDQAIWTEACTLLESYFGSITLENLCQRARKLKMEGVEELF